MSYKVLVTEAINEKGIEYLRDHNCEVVFGTGASEEILLKECPGCDGALTRNGKFTPAVFDACPSLKVVSMHGAGVDGIDVDAATAHGVAVCNTPNSNSTSVAEYAMCMIAMCAKHLAQYNTLTKDGQKDVARKIYGNDLEGKTLGIFGTGKIGTKLAHIAHFGFGMNVIGYNRHIDAKQPVDYGFLTPDLEEVFKTADFVSLHIPSSPATFHKVNESLLGLMKPSAYLVNCGRGEVVDEAVLVKLLQEGKLAGAALDVVEGNLPKDDNPLLKMDNVIITPHTAAFTIEALQNMACHAAQGICEVLAGQEPTWCVNKKDLK